MSSTSTDEESGYEPKSPPALSTPAFAASWSLEPALPPNGRRKASSPRAGTMSVSRIREEEDDEAHRYTAEDVANSLREGADESDHIRSLETRPQNPNLARETLFSRIETTLLETVQDHEEGARGESNRERNVDGCDDAETTDPSSTPTRYSPRSEATQESPRISRKPSPFGSPGRHAFRALSKPSTPPHPAPRTGADLYYENAAKMLPSPRNNNNINDHDWNSERVTSNMELGLEAEEPGDVSDGSTHVPKSESNLPFRLFLSRLGNRTRADVDYFRECVEPHKQGLLKSFQIVALQVMLPSLILAVVLFYGFDNPPNGLALAPCVSLPDAASTAVSDTAMTERQEPATLRRTPSPTLIPTLAPSITPTGLPTWSPSPTQTPTTAEQASWLPTTSTPTISPTRKPTYTFSDMKNETLCTSEQLSLKEASVSWWILFVGVRQVSTLCGAAVLQLIVVDFFTFRTRWFPGMFGTKVALAIGQSKGWPCVVFFWAILDLILLFGPRKFARNWLYFQLSIDLFNSNNPSGDVPNNKYYKRIIYFAVALSVAATIKRTMMANFVGRRVVSYYMQDLSELMKKLLLIGEIAELSNSDVVEHKLAYRKSVFRHRNSVGRMVVNELGDNAAMATNGTPATIDDQACSSRNLDANNGKSTMSALLGTGGNAQRSNMFMTAIFENLDEWEEPELQEEYQTVSMRDVLQFRRAVDFINSIHPFSPAFGKATTREECAQASQKTFDKLLENGKKVLRFDTLCQIAQNPDGTHDRQMVLELVRLFRPSRSGVITKLEFVKSVDIVYKQLRLILANINSSSQIDQAYGRITNVFFYSVGAVVWLFMMGVDVQHVFLGIAGIVVSFAFMISSASSKYLEGILLILVRKPYDIGDRVCFMDANAPVNAFGPAAGGWMVESVDLYTTTVRLGTTREYATFTNGSLANSRILNLRRSDKPNIYMYLKFTMNVTKEQLNEFRIRIVEFIKDRPREWIKVVSLRCTDVETEHQYLKYVLIVQHRESWQSFATIQSSKGDVYIHALHLMKELGMNYTAPKLPVQLSGDPRTSLVRSVLDGSGGNGRIGIGAERFFDDPYRGALFEDAEVTRTGSAAVRSNANIVSESGGEGFGGNRNPIQNIDSTRSWRPQVVFQDESNSRATSDGDGSVVRRKGGRNTSSGTEQDSSEAEPLRAHGETKNKHT